MAVHKLTALWALSESGLGGLLHAVKSPFSGIFLGGFAIFIVCCIAHFSKNKWKDITQATLLVLLVKAAASPHSPPTAYIAVAFQGLVGAALLSSLGKGPAASMTFGAVALLESALQKVLVTTLIFGVGIWEAIDSFMRQALRFFQIENTSSFSEWLIGAYLATYALVGLLVGYWAQKFIKQLKTAAPKTLAAYHQLVPNSSGEPPKKKKKKKWLQPLLVLAFIVMVFLFQGAEKKALYILLRTVAALLLLQFLLRPLLVWLIQKWRKGQSKSQENALQAINASIVDIRHIVTPAYRLAKAESSGWRVFPQFVNNVVILSLYASEPVHPVQTDTVG